MHMVAPRTGAPEISVAEEQHEYRQLTCAEYAIPEGHPFAGARYLVSRWRFSDEDLAALVGVSLPELARLRKGRTGEDLYVSHLTWDGPLQPFDPQVGTGGWVAVSLARHTDAG